MLPDPFCILCSTHDSPICSSLCLLCKISNLADGTKQNVHGDREENAERLQVDVIQLSERERNDRWIIIQKNVKLLIY